MYAQYELLPRISDAARRVTDAGVLRKVTLSIVERLRVCIQPDGSHFKHLLDWTVQSYKLHRKLNCSVFFQPHFEKRAHVHMTFLTGNGLRNKFLKYWHCHRMPCIVYKSIIISVNMATVRNFEVMSIIFNVRKFFPRRNYSSYCCCCCCCTTTTTTTTTTISIRMYF